jgi:hypothetical protein
MGVGVPVPLTSRMGVRRCRCPQSLQCESVLLAVVAVVLQKRALANPCSLFAPQRPSPCHPP